MPILEAEWRERQVDGWEPMSDHQIAVQEKRHAEFLARVRAGLEWTPEQRAWNFAWEAGGAVVPQHWPEDVRARLDELWKDMPAPDHEKEPPIPTPALEDRDMTELHLVQSALPPPLPPAGDPVEDCFSPYERPPDADPNFPRLNIIALGHVMREGSTEPDMLVPDLVVRGVHNTWFGEPGCGKTWIAAAAVIVPLLNAGQVVVWADKEMSRKAVARSPDPARGRPVPGRRVPRLPGTSPA